MEGGGRTERARAKKWDHAFLKSFKSTVFKYPETWRSVYERWEEKCIYWLTVKLAYKVKTKQKTFDNCNESWKTQNCNNNIACFYLNFCRSLSSSLKIRDCAICCKCCNLEHSTDNTLHPCVVHLKEALMLEWDNISENFILKTCNTFCAVGRLWLIRTSVINKLILLFPTHLRHQHIDVSV